MLYREQKDENLVMLTLAGDKYAYEILVTRYEKAVVAAANSVVGNRYLAEDAAQDAFITAWMKLDMLREPGKYGSWVCRIAKNCAKKMVIRYRSFLPLEVVENYIADDERGADPLYLYVSSEEKELLHESIAGLPERVGEVIRLHYFEELSVAEIAERLCVSRGTVKAQLHDGRRRIRKELCAVDERIDDTLVERVMKKVEELKLWRMKNSKNGFEVVYRDVLAEVENLPECTDKYHALADVLMRGWWWVPGEKNDALLARIREAAELGKNDDVMTFIVASEDEKVWGNARIAFIRDEQIPKLRDAGFVRALGYEWYSLGNEYFGNGQPELGFEAYEQALSVLPPSDVYRSLVKSAAEVRILHREKYADKTEDMYRLGGGACEIGFVNGEPRKFDELSTHGPGEHYSGDRWVDYILDYAAYCDGIYFASELGVGESHVGSDGAKLIFVSDSETVKTPAGTFENCKLWEISCYEQVNTYNNTEVYKAYYKDGVGIVKFEHILDGFAESRVLASKNVTGEGIFPLEEGNTWEYVSEHKADVMSVSIRYTVTYRDGEKAVLTNMTECERYKYDENSWIDMMEDIRQNYFRQVAPNDWRVCDVSHAIERTEALARTPIEKVHTKLAASTARRIMETDPTFNPDCTATGHWNFFMRQSVMNKNGKLTLGWNGRWNFELKSIGGSMGGADYPLLFNDIYGILEDATECIWSEDWCVGATPVIKYEKYDDEVIETELVCEDGGSITTKAGTFDNCLKLSLNIKGMGSGREYRGGNKEYYFAPGVGIVRTVNEYCGGARRAVYELSSYEGEGDGYMPIADGMTRRYDALDLTDGFVGSADYAYVADENGDVYIISDRCGIRILPPPVTSYGAIQDEVIEDRLWDEGKHDESRLRNSVNNFRLLLHFLGRPSRTWAAPEKAVEWGKYRLKLIEGLSCNGEVPPAWYGGYTMSTFRVGCALCGLGRNEEGYEYIEKAFELSEAWLKYERGTPLDVGHPLIYGGVKLIKDMGVIELPDGTREPIPYDWIFEFNGTELHYALTAPRGWEWFDGVRNEKRYHEYIERAKKLADSVKK